MEEIFIVDGEEYEEVQEQLKRSLQQLKEMSGGHYQNDVCFGNGTMRSEGEEEGGKLNFDKEQTFQFALVINGHSLVRVFCFLKLVRRKKELIKVSLSLFDPLIDFFFFYQSMSQMKKIC